MTKRKQRLKIPPLEWTKRPRKETSALAERKVWQTKDKRYRVEESQITYGIGLDASGNPTGYPPFFRAMTIKPNRKWAIISTHRKRNPAIKACERHAATTRQQP